MKKLLSLPPNLVNSFYDLENVDKNEWFCTSDPEDSKLGSGGGTSWLLKKCHEAESPDTNFSEWLQKDKRILLHAGGQSRRLPSYAPSGKVLAPVPVFRWSRGQKLSQDLLSLQIPLYDKIMDAAPDNIHTLVASGDVYIHCDKPLPQIPEADVVCYGLWTDAEVASHHGVFVFDRSKPNELECMLQKPSPIELANMSNSKIFLTDIGIWLLSDKAVRVLNESCEDISKYGIANYDLYSGFGFSLGSKPQVPDLEIKGLTVAVLTLEDGGFYHFGTSKELISSALKIQNIVTDQREIKHHRIKPHPAMFVQNSVCDITLTSDNYNLWIENSIIPSSWTISHDNIITGIPTNIQNIELLSGQCVDMVPIDRFNYAVRPYGINDAFRGPVNGPETNFLNRRLKNWAEERDIYADFEGNTTDIQSFPMFPVVKEKHDIEVLLKWFLTEPNLAEGRYLWQNSPKLSADQLSAQANLSRLFKQRIKLRNKNYQAIADNYKHSIFFQMDLASAAKDYANYHIVAPPELPKDDDLMNRIQNKMFISRVLQLKDKPFEYERSAALSLLSDGIVDATITKKEYPKFQLIRDQILWGRSPVRIDLAGGWTDTPPHSIYAGGNVVNIAVELNGQPPIQVYAKPCKDFQIVLRSIDLGAQEVIRAYDELSAFNKVGSPFSIPKAALALAGFLPKFCEAKYNKLEDQLKDFGCGIEISLVSALPAGSGMGTSSILGATVLSVLSEMCGLQWSRYDVCRKTLVIEQLLTTGGGWQDQYGGIFQGIKMLKSSQGFYQNPDIMLLPEYLFTEPEYKNCHLLYYTGITRTAKNILSEIVTNMFLNSSEHLQILADMKTHAEDLCRAVQFNDFDHFGRLVKKSWQQNKRLDSGVNPPDVEKLISLIDDYALGYKLPGAGGGGYLYIVAKDPLAAFHIRTILANNPLRNNARFTEMEISTKGIQVSVS